MGEKFSYNKKLTWFSFLNILIKRWYIPVAIILISLIVSTCYSLLNIFPSYSCTARLYIINKEENSLSSGDLAVSTSLARDFEIIINDDAIIGEVAQALNYKYSASQIKSFISVDNPSNTRIIELTAITPNAEAAKQITSSICDIAQDKLIDIMGVDRISVVSKGNVGVEPARTKQINIILNSLFLGLIISVLVLMLITMGNNKITSAKEIENILELNVLGTIPYNKKIKAKYKKD